MKGAFNNERTYWANQIKGVMSFRKWKDKLNNMNERSHELLKNEMYMKGPLRNTNERSFWKLKDMLCKTN